ncbi:ATP-dependent DNA helicase [Chondrocystis sp. NIES-4102]|nr:ATP-dependent DNA helicase [Chondrocystis sp. NIES-4102]
MIEVEVHSYLRDFLRVYGDRNFPHHLTMARLIARALRLGRPVLVQTGSSVSKYCLGYLMPLLLGDWSVVIVAPPSTQEYLLNIELPRLQDWLGTNKKVRIGDRALPDDQLLLTDPENWLADRLGEQQKFPPHLLTIIDRADNLAEWTRQLLTNTLTTRDWEQLLEVSPQEQDLIRNTRIKLTKSIFTRPENPYRNYVLLDSELALINDLCAKLNEQKQLNAKFLEFWQQLADKSTIAWISRDREQGLFTINLAPPEVKTKLQPIWQQQPVIIIGSFLDIDPLATTYRQQLGLDAEMLSLKFTPNRQNNHLHLYIPDRFPLPNTPDFQSALIEQSLLLVSLSSNSDYNQLIVVIVEDCPLQGQVGSALAAQFGSRVKVEDTAVTDNSILISGWSFWKQHQETLPIPRLLVIATLPIPSLENPLVANRVNYHKNKRQDWFRMYLLPTALQVLEQTLVPLRESQSIVALFDNRVNFRSYGKTILAALEPCDRVNYIDPTWFGYPDS